MESEILWTESKILWTESKILWTESKILWTILIHFNVVQKKVHWRNPKLKSLNSMPAVLLQYYDEIMQFLYSISSDEEHVVSFQLAWQSLTSRGRGGHPACVSS